MQPSNLANRPWLFLFILLGAFYLWGLGTLPFAGPDEPRYAEVAREMFLRRDWITPTLGGRPWFEKPALLYWFEILSYRLFGVSEFAAALGPAVCGLLTAIFVYWLGRSIGDASEVDEKTWVDRTAIARWSALVYLSSLGAILFSRAANFDVVLTMTVAGALACYFAAIVKLPSTREPADQSPRIRLILFGFYFFTGLSLLAKGLAGYVIIFGSITLYYVVRREWPHRRIISSLLWGLPVSLGVAATWYGPMIARHGYVFIDQFIIQHHFARFATNKYHHPQPIYFYPLILLALVSPWTIALVASWFSTRRWNWRGRLPLDRGRVLALAWLILPVVFFSISRSKLPGYILPVLPACALLVGERIACFIRDGRGEKVIRASGALLIIMAAAAFWFALQNFVVHRSWLLAAALIPVVVGLFMLIRPGWREAAFVMMALAVVMSCGVALKRIAPVVAASESVRDLMMKADERGYSNLRVVQLHTIERTAEFYAAGRINYGNDGEPVKLEGANQVVDTAQQSGGRILCLVPIEYVTQLTALSNAHVEIIGDNSRVYLVSVAVK